MVRKEDTRGNRFIQIFEGEAEAFVFCRERRGISEEIYEKEDVIRLFRY